MRLTIISVLSNLLFTSKNEYKKILINRDGAFGDSIVALPALSLIRQKHPKAQIDLLSTNNGNVSFKDLGLNKDLINNLYTVKKDQRKETLKLLKKQKYDLFIQIPQNIGIYKSSRNMFLVRFYLNIGSAFGWDCGRIKSFMRLQKERLTTPTETDRFINILQEHFDEYLPESMNHIDDYDALFNAMVKDKNKYKKIKKKKRKNLKENKKEYSKFLEEASEILNIKITRWG